MNSEEFDKKYREFKIGDDLHDDIKFYISDEKLNKDIHRLIEKNKELENKCTNQKITIVGALEDIKAIDGLLISFISDIEEKYDMHDFSTITAIEYLLKKTLIKLDGKNKEFKI